MPLYNKVQATRQARLAADGEATAAGARHQKHKDTPALKIRRVSGITSEGRAAIGDEDVFDSVEVTSKTTIVEEALLQFFAAQSDVGAR